MNAQKHLPNLQHPKRKTMSDAPQPSQPLDQNYPSPPLHLEPPAPTSPQPAENVESNSPQGTAKPKKNEPSNTKQPPQTGPKRSASSSHQATKERTHPYVMPSKQEAKQDAHDEHPPLPPSRQTKKKDHTKRPPHQNKKPQPDNTDHMEPDTDQEDANMSDAEASFHTPSTDNTVEHNPETDQPKADDLYFSGAEYYKHDQMLEEESQPDTSSSQILDTNISPANNTPNPRESLEPEETKTTTSRFPTLLTRSKTMSTTNTAPTSTESPFLHIPSHLLDIALDNETLYTAVHPYTLDEWMALSENPAVIAYVFGSKPKRSGFEDSQIIEQILSLEFTNEEKHLVKTKIRVTTEHAVFFHPPNLGICKLVFCIQHYNMRPDEAGCKKVVNMIRWSIIENGTSDFRHFVKEHCGIKGPISETFLDNICNDVLSSIYIKGFMLGGTNPDNKHGRSTPGQPIFAVYMKSPVNTLEQHQDFLEMMKSIKYGDVTCTAKVVNSFNCNGCKAVDHILTVCPFLNIPGWPHPIVETRQGNRRYRGHAREPGNANTSFNQHSQGKPGKGKERAPNF
ncbi:hypothetical protein BJ165DRAFT_1534373 [Panaeolus papilionaceus]|nr:hypothetical protein BJ165DRAFT_1534373 [Panaeolus papilionaceus]